MKLIGLFKHTFGDYGVDENGVLYHLRLSLENGGDGYKWEKVFTRFEPEAPAPLKSCFHDKGHLWRDPNNYLKYKLKSDYTKPVCPYCSKSSCEHNNKIEGYWWNGSDEEGALKRKSIYPECPFCTPRPKSARDPEENNKACGDEKPEAKSGRLAENLRKIRLTVANDPEPYISSDRYKFDPARIEKTAFDLMAKFCVDEVCRVVDRLRDRGFFNHEVAKEIKDYFEEQLL